MHDSQGEQTQTKMLFSDAKSDTQPSSQPTEVSNPLPGTALGRQRPPRLAWPLLGGSGNSSPQHKLASAQSSFVCCWQDCACSVPGSVQRMAHFRNKKHPMIREVFIFSDHFGINKGVMLPAWRSTKPCVLPSSCLVSQVDLLAGLHLEIGLASNVKDYHDLRC